MPFLKQYVCCLVLVVLSVSSSQAQEIPPVITNPPPRYVVVQREGDVGDASVGGKVLTNFDQHYLAQNGDLFVRNLFGNSNFDGVQVSQKKTIPNGPTINLYSPVPNYRTPCEVPFPGGVSCSYGENKNAFFSPNGNYYYITELRNKTVGIGTELLVNRIVNGLSMSDVVIDMKAELKSSPVIKVNNEGTILIYFRSFTGGAHEILTIDRFGNRRIIASLAQLIRSNTIAINSKGTVFYAANDGTVYAVPDNKPAKIIGQTFAGYISTYGSFIAPEVYPELYPEGILYYMKSSVEIVSSDGVVQVSTVGKNVSIDSFSVNDSGSIIWTGVMSIPPYQWMLFKGPRVPEDLLFRAGDLVDGVTVNFFRNPMINNQGDTAFTAFDGGIKNHLFRNGDPQKLCKVQDKGRLVKWYGQTNANWNQPGDRYANLPGKTMGALGCYTTSIAMLFDSYGLSNLPGNFSLDPGKLNEAMYTYGKKRSSIDDRNGRGYTVEGNVRPDGAAEIARAGYTQKCKLTKSEAICKEESKSIVSYKDKLRTDVFDEEKQKYVEDQICSGNPIILKVEKVKKKADGKPAYHFLLATGFELDDAGKKTFIVNDPGRSAQSLGESSKLSALKDRYKSIAGIRPFVQAADPSMIFAYGSENTEFILTDPLGRKTGYDPISKLKYNEIPGASYEVQSIDSNNEDLDEVPTSLVVHNVFTSMTDVVDGDYQVQIFGLNDGKYLFEMYHNDKDGFANGEEIISGSISKGEVKSLIFKHTSENLPILNSELNIKHALYINKDPKNRHRDFIVLHGSILLVDRKPIVLTQDVEIAIGGLAYNKIKIPASSFKITNFSKKTIYTSFNSPDYKVILQSDGSFLIELRSIELNNIPRGNWGSFILKINDSAGEVNMGLKCHKNNCVYNGRR